MNAPENASTLADPLVVGERRYRSRLLVGTGKYRDFAQTRDAIVASGAEIVTVAIRRTNIGQNAGEASLLDALPPTEFTYLPNSAGCYTAEDAVRTLRLGRELLDGHALCKLEVLGDSASLYPDVRQTLKAAEQLVADRFADRLGHGNSQPVESSPDPRAGARARPGRRGRRHRLGRGDRDGARVRGRADEHGHCAGAGSGTDGAREAPRGGSRAGRVPGGTHAAQVVRRQSELADVRTHLVKWLAVGALGALLPPAPCGAAPPTPVELTKLCSNAEDQAHCGRLVEARQLQRQKAVATREGDELHIQLLPAGLATFRDAVNIVGARTYAVWDYIDDLEAIVLFATNGDRSEFWIVERRGGGEFRVPSEPVLAPGHKRFATADFCAEGCDNEVAVWKPSETWADAGVAWKSSESLSVEYTVAKESSPRTLERRLNDATWNRVR
jgi:hypothetical protein